MSISEMLMAILLLYIILTSALGISLWYACTCQSFDLRFNLSNDFPTTSSEMYRYTDN